MRSAAQVGHNFNFEIFLLLAAAAPFAHRSRNAFRTYPDSWLLTAMVLLCVSGENLSLQEWFFLGCHGWEVGGVLPQYRIKHSPIIYIHSVQTKHRSFQSTSQRHPHKRSAMTFAESTDPFSQITVKPIQFTSSDTITIQNRLKFDSDGSHTYTMTAQPNRLIISSNLRRIMLFN